MSDTGAPRQRVATRARTAVWLALAALLPLAAGSIVYRQGIDLLDDGLWLLGARVLADGVRAVTGPSFDAGRFYIRNLREIVAVELR